MLPPYSFTRWLNSLGTPLTVSYLSVSIARQSDNLFMAVLRFELRDGAHRTATRFDLSFAEYCALLDALRGKPCKPYSTPLPYPVLIIYPRGNYSLLAPNNERAARPVDFGVHACVSLLNSDCRTPVFDCEVYSSSGVRLVHAVLPAASGDAYAQIEAATAGYYCAHESNSPTGYTRLYRSVASLYPSS